MEQKIYLDLCEVQKLAEVWLKGERLGITWAGPHRYDITGFIKPVGNKLRVEVANLWSNRLKGDALTGDSYTNINIRETIIPGEGILAGDQTRYQWQDAPLIPSGLLGPVGISNIKQLKIQMQ